MSVFFQNQQAMLFSYYPMRPTEFAGQFYL